MPEVRGAAFMARKGKMAYRTDEKSDALRKFQGRFFFEKSLSASSVSHPGKAMLLPSWFVKKHGDKFQKSVVLRTESSIKSWDVKLTIFRKTPTCTRVLFSGGWKDFSTSNGLLEGDSLIFSLTAMSEFEVYIYPGTRNPKHCPSQGGPREWSNGSEPSRKKVKQEPYENKDEQLADERMKLNGLFAMKKTIGVELAVSASGHSSTSCSAPSNIEDLDHLVLGSIRFEKTLSASNVSKFGKSTLALPTWFVKEHGDKFRKSVILRSESSTKSWNVNLTIECRSSGSTPENFGRGWNAFVTSHGLLVGDLLIFSLTAMSEFAVYIFPGTRNPKRCPSQGGPREWSDGSEPSRKIAKQSYERKDQRVPAEGLFAIEKF